MRFRELKLRKDADCPVCGTHPTVTELIDYEQFCGVAPHQVAAAARAGRPSTDALTSRELKAELDRGDQVVIVDVREPQEFQINRIARLDADPARRPAEALRRARPEREHRHPVQVRHAERQGAGVPAFQRVYATSGT